MGTVLHQPRRTLVGTLSHRDAGRQPSFYQSLKLIETSQCNVVWSGRWREEEPTSNTRAPDVCTHSFRPIDQNSNERFGT